MSLLIPHVSPRGPCLFRMPWGRGLKCQGLGTLCGAWEPASTASSASRLSVIPSCSSSSSLGRREGDLPGSGASVSAGPSWDQLWEGRDARVAGSPQGRDFRETFREWGRQQGFHIWPGRTERAVRQGEVMEGLDSTGVGG